MTPTEMRDYSETCMRCAAFCVVPKNAIKFIRLALQWECLALEEEGMIVDLAELLGGKNDDATDDSLSFDPTGDV